MNPGLVKLQPYPFEKLGDLLQAVNPVHDKSPIKLSIGEPKHETPVFILDALREALPKACQYPTTLGLESLRQVIADWLIKRFRLPENSVSAATQILPVNGTREAIFAFAQSIVDHSASHPVVMFPNPFYQIYEGAALLAGAEPVYVNCEASNSFLPDFSVITDNQWKRCQLLYLCSPANPSGAVMSQSSLQELFEYADKYDFIIAADECYSEIYDDEDSPPLGLLQASHQSGRTDFARCVVFHSLSKRSNVPGMRSGFVAGDERLVQQFKRYRTYHGCSMPLYTQAASICAWQDESHVKMNRALYREKFTEVGKILAPVMNLNRPPAGFYLWPVTPIEDTSFARGLFNKQNITVLPGSFLSREVSGSNPGKNRIRIALVPEIDICVDAANRIREYIDTI